MQGPSNNFLILVQSEELVYFVTKGVSEFWIMLLVEYGVKEVLHNWLWHSCSLSDCQNDPKYNFPPWPLVSEKARENEETAGLCPNNGTQAELISWQLKVSEQPSVSTGVTFKIFETLKSSSLLSVVSALLSHWTVVLCKWSVR